MHSPTLHDPAGSAFDTASSFLQANEELCVREAPAAMARCKQARSTYLRFLGEEPPYAVASDDGAMAVHPFHTLDKSVFALASEVYAAGIAADVVYENLRSTLAAPGRLCRTCGGVGQGRVKGSIMGHGTPCTECRGRGVLDER